MMTTPSYADKDRHHHVNDYCTSWPLSCQIGSVICLGYRLFDWKLKVFFCKIIDMSDNKKILIIEDEENIAKLLKYNLEGAGYDCKVSRSGESGLRYLAKEKVDLVLLDIM